MLSASNAPGTNRVLPSRLWRHPVHFVALGFGSGLLPKAPGTFGTMAAVPLCLALKNLPPGIYLLVVGGAFAIGVWVCAYTAQRLGDKDHPAIVWDEIVGYLATLVWIPIEVWTVIVGFVLFRIFDILKPWPVGLIDRTLTGGLGIMTDDLAAAVCANLVLQVLLWVVA